MKKIRENLFMQFLAFILLLLIIVTAVFAMNQYNAKKVTRESTLQLNENTLMQLEGKMDEAFISMENLMSNLAYNPTVYSYFKEEQNQRSVQEDLKDVMINSLISNDNIAGIELYDMEGKKRIGVGKRYQEDVNPEDINTIRFSDRILTNDGGMIKYAIYYPIYDLKNIQYFTKLGVCIFYVSIGNITEFLNEVKITDNTYLYLVDKEWDILAQNTLAENNSGFLQNWNSNKNRYHVSEIKVKRNGWTIISYVPIAELVQGMDFLNREMQMLYFFSIGILILLVCFCYRAIINPLHQIDLFVKRNPTHTEERMCFQNSNEIGTLARNLNRMLDERDTMNQAIQDSQKKIYETQLAKKQMEILAYRNQINPHFLYNTLNTIKWMAIMKGEDSIVDCTSALGDLLQPLYRDNRTFWSLENEKNYIISFGKIMNYRYGEKVALQIDINEELYGAEIPKFVLQPIAENAFLYGVSEKEEITVITISGWREEGDLLLRISDNGEGLEETKLVQLRESLHESLNESRETNHIGISNVHQRIQLLYGPGYGLEIDSIKERGFCVTMRLAFDKP